MTKKIKSKMVETNCIKCGKRFKTVERYSSILRDVPVRDVYCSPACRREFERAMWMTIGYADGGKDTIKVIKQFAQKNCCAKDARKLVEYCQTLIDGKKEK